MKPATFICFVILLTVISCSTQRKLEGIRRYSTGVSLVPSGEKGLPDSVIIGKTPHRDTLTVQAPDGHEMIIMRAVRDENGEMVANDVIDAAVVTARFRNVAERHGKVDLRFTVTVPASLQDSKWQLRFQPEMSILDETVQLDPIVITGRDYRKAQLRGYQQYERFLQSIIADTTRFIRLHELEVFLKRNLPEVYELKTDSTYISDERFASIYGVTQKEAVEHYTNQFVVNSNRRKIARKDRMFAKYVKVPIINEGLRLDTVINAAGGDFVYEYVQTINTQPKLKKAGITMTGAIYEEDRKIYTIPNNDPLTFYISSLSSFVMDGEKYLTRIVERSVTANSACWIDFRSGKSDIDPEMGNNRSEINRIKGHLAGLLENRDFDLDSILVTASCSPEGSYESNKALSQRRSRSVSEYFDRYIRHYRDSLVRDRGVSLFLDGTATHTEDAGKVQFISRSVPENWEMLAGLLEDEDWISPSEMDAIRQTLKAADPDARERALQSHAGYKKIRESLYPRLRTVRFDFYLHRRGMQKDTVHTTVVDSCYMRGVQAIKDRDYETAVTLLRPYHDFNTAIAFCSMDYNMSALEILKELKKDAQVNYMLAIIYCRLGDDRSAAECFLKACDQDPAFVHRGNLDPEISGLMKQYDIHINNDL